MLDKIRLQSEGKLDDAYHPSLGRGGDLRLTKFLHIDYEKLRARVLEGGSDDEILEWCYANGHGWMRTTSRSGTVSFPSWAGTMPRAITWWSVKQKPACPAGTIL